MSYFGAYSIYYTCINIIDQERDKRRNQKNPHYVSPRRGKAGRIPVNAMHCGSNKKTIKVRC